MNEAEARVKVDSLLRRAKWRLPGDASPNVRMEQHTGDGIADYTLQDSRGYPLAVAEAKNSDTEPLHAKEQARGYAEKLRARFVILSNGDLHYLWDLQAGNPVPIMEMPTQESLQRRGGLEHQPSSFGAESVGADYIAQTQGESTPPERRRNLREYQLNAVRAVQSAAAGGKRRFLLEMATGTGKTLIAAALIKLFLRSGNAGRALFLVDRLELEDQAQKNFTEYLGNDYQSVIYKANRADWNRAEIVISTVQSLAANDRFRRFSPLDFELLIVDEAHRSIGGRNSRAVFEYFIGSKLGLTATPRDFMRGINAGALAADNPTALEARQFRDTYTTFGCAESGPTFSYGLPEGVKDGYLINPYIVDARTEITTRLLSDEGAAFTVRGDDDEGQQVVFTHRDYERRLFSQATNRALCGAFMEHALRDPLSDEIGKSIAYCVNQNHAANITRVLNELASEMFPGKYQSDFAMQVTSRVEGSGDFARGFANNTLRGQTKFLESYKTSKTRVCVTVGMMTTGYDCPDLLNLCFMRPLFSPSEFIQMKGRGTRTHRFRYRDGEGVEHSAEKKRFKLFDFFAVCEYFEQDHDYDESLSLPSSYETGKSNDDDVVSEPPQCNKASYEGPDNVIGISEIPVGPEGMRLDHAAFTRFAERVSADGAIQQAVEREQWGEAVRLVQKHHENKPEDYVTPAKIAIAENLQRRLESDEVLRRIFGLIDHFKNRDEMLNDEARKFIAIERLDDAHQAIGVFKAYIDSETVRNIIANGRFAELADNPKLSDEEWLGLKKTTRDAIAGYVRDYVRLDCYKPM